MSFHEGELLVQERAGVLDEAGRVGQMLRRVISPTPAAFLAAQRFIVLATATDAGEVWVTALSGPAGFLETGTEGRSLRIAATPRSGDPAAPGLRPGAHVGLVAIDFVARRRYRVNGTVVTVGRELVVDVQEAFGNCPKYIHGYRALPDGPVARKRGRSAAGLDEQRRRWIERAETFFLGTLHRDAGADASHRGGAPGFVRVTGPRDLSWGDYPGNQLFQSLGNAAVHPATGLLFIEPESGSTLQLSGRLEIDWSPEAASIIPGAERILRFHIERLVETPGALPLRWAQGAPSPFNPPAP